MTEVSPSSKKVDDFLSSISELSQERLREDQKRQRDLQRNIDVLRLRLNSSSPVKGLSSQSLVSHSSTSRHRDIPLLKFNRSLKLSSDEFSTNMKDLEEDKPPEMPQRPGSVGRQYKSSRLDEFNETPPPMPRRPTSDKESPPPMPPRRDIKKPGPPRPSKPSGMTSQFDIELINPVPMKARPELMPKQNIKEPTNKPNPSSTEGHKYKSFTELEHDIKKGSDVRGKTKEMVDDIFTVDSTTDSKPIKPIKSDKLSTKTNVNDKAQGTPTLVPKPTYLSALSATKHQIEPSMIQSGSSGTKQRYIPEHNDPSDVSIIKSTSPEREKKQNSWIDSAIRKNDSSEPPGKVNKEKDLQSKQAKSLEPEYLSLLAKVKSPEPQKSNFKTPPKPPKPSLEHYTRAENELLKSQMQKLSSSKNKSAPPPKPAKPSISKYEEKDTELLKSQMQKLSQGKNVPPKPSKPSPKKYQDEDNAILLSQMKKLGKNSNSYTRESIQQSSPEGLAALAKLKPVKPAPSSKPVSDTSMPEPIKKLEQMKTSDRSPEKSDFPERPVATKSPSSSDLREKKPSKSPASFQDQLSSIIRASTVPNVRTSKPASNISRANTLPLHNDSSNSVQSKLTHPNKGRSKGPKRRLPKKIANGSSTADGPGSADTNLNTNTSSSQIIDFKQKKLPPPVNKASKQKALDNLKPSRKFSGELFI